jgi:hypothetical protein
MKKLKQLCLVLSVGGMTALSISACGDDTTPPPGAAGTGSGMAGTGSGMAGTGTGTAGTGTAGTGTAGTGTAGTGTAGTGTAGTGTAGTGTAGTASGGGTGGASGGTGGASGGSGGKGGSGGASGGSGGASGGSGGGGGGAPSADCMKWCSGAMGVVTFCAGSGLAPNVDSEAKCIAHCTAPEAAGVMGLQCWNEHLANAIKAMPDAATAKTTHCPHASGAQSQTVCNKTM